MTAVRFAVATAVFLFLLLAALSNTETVSLRFLRFAAIDAPLAFVVFGAFAIGVACGLAAGAWRNVRLRRTLARLRREARSPGRPPVPATPHEPPIDVV